MKTNTAAATPKNTAKREKESCLAVPFTGFLLTGFLVMRISGGGRPRDAA
jgi:hypothetical protein